MLLLYHNEDGTVVVTDDIYIPLCFYFIGYQRRNGTRAGREIYIPLCFYFIDAFADLRSLIFVIYIPLCFYFIDKGSDADQDHSRIYIPLCFYFIAC